LYDVLQVSPWCEPEVIQAAYRALARTRHPDVNRDPDAEDQMRRLNVAYQTLSDPARRTRYDEELALEAARPIGARPAPSAVDPMAQAAWTPPPPTPIRPRPGAGAPRSGPPGAGSAGGAASGGAGTGPAAPSPASAYQPTIFDAGGNMLLPRSAIYVSLVMVTVILALVAWLILDALSQRPSVAPRFQNSMERMTVPSPRSALPAGASPAGDRVVVASLPSDGLALVSGPGLSSQGARWNE
jgi:hypothetical protein